MASSESGLISKSTNAQEKPYTKLQILDRISKLDIFQGVILDYCVVGKDQGVYLKLKHLENKIKGFSKKHILLYDNLECFCLGICGTVFWAPFGRFLMLFWT